MQATITKAISNEKADRFISMHEEEGTFEDTPRVMELRDKEQVIAMRKKFNANVRFVLMNSFSTSEDTMSYLQKYPEIISDPELEFVQNKVPKIDAATLLPGEVNRFFSRLAQPFFNLYFFSSMHSPFECALTID